AAFVVLRSENFLLGDTQNWVSAIAKGIRAGGGAHREPLPQALVTTIHRSVGEPLGWSVTSSFLVTGLPLGLTYLLLSAAIARRLSSSSAGSVFVFSAIGLGGALQLFAGYAEYYAFAATASLLVAWLGIRWADGDGRLIWLGLGFAFAILCHAQMMFALPAILVLVGLAIKHGKWKEALATLLAIPVAAGLALLVLGFPFAEILGHAARSQHVLPPFGKSPFGVAYSAFAWVHAVDLLNVALLVAPALPVAVALCAGGRTKRRGIFLITFGSGLALFAIIVNPNLGMVRDWDIFVVPVIAVALWACQGAGSRLSQEDSDTAGDPAGKAQTLRLMGSGSLAGAVLVITLLHSLFWLYGNHHPHSALERIRRVAHNDKLFGPASLGETWRYIGSSELRSGDVERAKTSFLTSIRSYPEERMTYRLLAQIQIGLAARAGGRAEAGLLSYHTALAQGAYKPGHAHLGALFAATTAGRDDLALEEARLMALAEPNSAEHLATWGDILRRSGSYGEAEDAYDRALALSPNNTRAVIGRACLAGVRGDKAGLEAGIRDALQRAPWSSQAQQFAAYLEQPGWLTPERCRKILYFR
ncbi:MAG: hypothetical protein OEN01_12570, partial [Candidatus Krumholzibacteria bacterium]|nr:hypothetical protein [Candidatus Krumholzibacteria bacterium]